MSLDLSSVSSGNLALAFLLAVFGLGLIAWLWPRRTKLEAPPTRAEWIAQNQAFAHAIDALEAKALAELNRLQNLIGRVSFSVEQNQSFDSRLNIYVDQINEQNQHIRALQAQVTRLLERGENPLRVVPAASPLSPDALKASIAEARDRQRLALIDCYMSEQMSEAQWAQHAKEDPELEPLRNSLRALRYGREQAPEVADAGAE